MFIKDVFLHPDEDEEMAESRDTDSLAQKLKWSLLFG